MAYGYDPYHDSILKDFTINPPPIEDGGLLVPKWLNIGDNLNSCLGDGKV